MIRPKKHLQDFYRSEPEQFDRTKYLRLDKNEDLCGLPKDFIKSCLDEITGDDLSAYPQTYRLYDRLSAFLSIPRRNILITTGSDAAIKNIFEVFISPGDGVIIPDPTYAMYEVYANLFCADLKKIPYSMDLTLSIGNLIEAIDERTRLVALANPNSPTGTVSCQEEIVDLIETCNARDILVLIDEAYYPYYPHTVIDLTDEYPNLIVTRTFSKAFGLASLRLGYAVAAPDRIKDLNVFRPIYETHGIAVSIGCAILERPDIIERGVRETVAGREYLVREMQKLGIDAYPSQSNFVNFKLDRSIHEPLIGYLKENGILIKAGANHPTLQNCIRITAGPVSSMDKVLRHISTFMTRRAPREWG